MEHKISALFDLRIEMYRHALFRYYAIECDNFTNAMYYQFLFLDAESRFNELQKQASSEEFKRYCFATFCVDYR